MPEIVLSMLRSFGGGHVFEAAPKLLASRGIRTNVPKNCTGLTIASHGLSPRWVRYLLSRYVAEKRACETFVHDKNDRQSDRQFY